MYVAMKCLDEYHAISRCIGDFHDEEFVEKIVVLDGGSTDFTVFELNRFPKVEVHTLVWNDLCPHMETTASNNLLGYIPNGKLLFILDFDEKMSDGLKEKLREIDKGEVYIPDLCAVHFSRRTFEPLRYDGSLFCMYDDNGWPMISHQIGQYPDYQCRMFIRHYRLHWINSPHHVLNGHDTEMCIDADIIHFNKDDLRDRINLEKKWALCQARRAELGLTADLFETDPKPEIAEFFSMEAWRGEKKKERTKKRK